MPVLDLGSNIRTQNDYETYGRILARAFDLDSKSKLKVTSTLRMDGVDLYKAQTPGHVNLLIAQLAEAVVQHILFSKGQIPEPISLTKSRKQRDATQSNTSRKARTTSARCRREDRMLQRLKVLRERIVAAIDYMRRTYSDSDKGEGSSSDASGVPRLDLRLLIVMGSSAAAPREVFVLDLKRLELPLPDLDHEIISLLGRAGDIDAIDEEGLDAFAEFVAESSQRRREKAREKTSGNWERKLVRMMVSEERLEAFLGAPLAPTRTHIFLSAPSHFRCMGWSARRHLDFNLDELCETASVDWGSSLDVSLSSISQHELLPNSHRPAHSRSFFVSDSTSSTADSWSEDVASDPPADTSLTSMSDDHASVKSAEVRSWDSATVGQHSTSFLDDNGGMNDKVDSSKDLVAERTRSSWGSSTAHGGEDDVNSSEGGLASQLGKRSADLIYGPLESGKRTRDDCAEETGALPLNSIPLSAARRRSKPPRPGSLLDRGRLRPQGGSDSSSVRSNRSFKRSPRCAGVQIDFTEADQDSNNMLSMQSPLATLPERCWFQCDTVLEGFR